MNKTCFECGEPAHHEHHVVPESLGGTKTLPLCETCHSKVHTANLKLSELQKLGVKRTVEQYKKDGKKWGGGGWNKTNSSIYPEVKKLKIEGKTLRQIASHFNLSYPTVWKIVHDKIDRTKFIGAT